MRESTKVLKEMFPSQSVGAEVGVCYGENAKDLFNNLPNLHLHLIDDLSELKGEDWDVRSSLGREIKDLPVGLYTWHKTHSVDASRDIPDGTLDFVYIDANHSFEFVIQDLRLWFPKVKKGGLICGHDYGLTVGQADVKRAVDGFFKELGKEVHIASNNDDYQEGYRGICDWWVYV